MKVYDGTVYRIMECIEDMTRFTQGLEEIHEDHLVGKYKFAIIEIMKINRNEDRYVPKINFAHFDRIFKFRRIFFTFLPQKFIDQKNC